MSAWQVLIASFHVHVFGEKHLHALGKYKIVNIDVPVIELLTAVAVSVVGSQARVGRDCQEL